MGRGSPRNVLGLLLACASLAATAGAQPCAHYPGQFHWVCEMSMPGYVDLITTNGSLLFAASDAAGLKIFDISQPDAPEEVSSLPGLTDCLAIAAAGDLACAARMGTADSRDPHIDLIDISDPSAPSILTTLSTPGIGSNYLPNCVTIDSTYVYALFSYQQCLLVVFDISDPDSTEAIAYQSVTGSGYGICVDGGRAYVAAGSPGLQVFDVSNPASPAHLGSYDTQGSAWFVEALGNTVLVGDRSANLYTIDVTDPRHPRKLAQFDTPGYLWGLKYIGSHALIADGDHGLYVVNVSDPHYIIPSGGLYVGGTATGVTRLGEYIYVAAGDAGVQVARFSVLGEVRARSTAICPANANSIGICRNVACITSATTGLRTYDITDPGSATPAGVLARPSASAVAGQGWHAYVTDAADSSLSVINVSTPSAPWIETKITLAGQPKDIVLDNDYAFVAAGAAGLQIVDISDFLAMELVAAIDSVYVGEVAVANGYAYLAGLGTFRIADVSDPGAPRLLGEAQLPGGATGIAAVNGYAYVTVGGGGLQVIDATDPGHPLLTKRVISRQASIAMDVFAVEDYVYFVDHMASGLYGSGLNVLDISNPAQPVLAGRVMMPSGGAALIAYGECVYVAGATADSGFRIFPAQCGGTTPVLAAELEARADSKGIELRWLAPSADFIEFAIDRAVGREPADADYRRIATLPAGAPASGEWHRFVDADVRPLQWYRYRILGRTNSGDEANLGEIASQSKMSTQVLLFAPRPTCSPGPFTLRFVLPLQTAVRLDVCDAAGRHVRALCRDRLGPGEHEVLWDGRDETGRRAPSGLYSVRLACGPREIAQRVIVVR